MSDDQRTKAGFAFDTPLRNQGFKEADTAAILASLKNSDVITVDEAAHLSPEHAEKIIEMAKLIDANRRK